MAMEKYQFRISKWSAVRLRKLYERLRTVADLKSIVRRKLRDK